MFDTLTGLTSLIWRYTLLLQAWPISKLSHLDGKHTVLYKVTFIQEYNKSLCSIANYSFGFHVNQITFFFSFSLSRAKEFVFINLNSVQTVYCIASTQSTEYQAFLPVVQIGSTPPPLTRKGVLHIPLQFQGGQTHSLRGRGWGDPTPTMGQSLWYSMYTKIPLRALAQFCMKLLLQSRDKLEQLTSPPEIAVKG